MAAAMAVLLAAASPRLLAAEPPRAAEPLRVAVVTQPNLPGSLTGVATRPVALKGYLLASLARVPSVEIVSPWRADQLCSQFSTTAHDVNAELVTRTLAAATRVDAVAYVAANDEKLTVTLTRGEATSSFALPPAPEQGDRAEPFIAAAGFVRAGLGLPLDAASPKAGPPPGPNESEVFFTSFVTQGIPPYLATDEEALLRPPPANKEAPNLALVYLVPIRRAQPSSAEVAARFLGSIYLAREALPRDFVNYGDDIIAALQATLGTPRESAAYPMLGSAPGIPFEGALQSLARPLLPAQQEAAVVDELIDGALHGDGKDKGLTAQLATPAKRVTPASREVSLGALRALGCMNIPAAGATLVEAAGSKDPRVREAAAAGLGRQTSEATAKALAQLASDADPAVALAAGLSLCRRGNPPAGLLASLRAAPDSLFAASPAAGAALAKLAAAEDRPRLAALAATLHGASRISVVAALLRVGSPSPAEATARLRDEEPAVILAALESLGGRPIPADLQPALKRLANDPDLTLAMSAYKLLAAGLAPDSPAERALRLECGSAYDRLSILTGMAGRRDIKPDPAMLALAMGNSHGLIRFEALRLTAEHEPAQLPARVRVGLADPHCWVRMQAACLAADRVMPELADAIKAALARETHGAIRAPLAAALAKATGAPAPPLPPAAPMVDAAHPFAWTGAITDVDIDYPPFDGVVCYIQAAQAHVASLAKRPLAAFCRVLWGLVPDPDALARSPRAFDELWHLLDTENYDSSLGNISGLDLRILGLGSDWAGSWRDFCREARIDPDRIAGDIERLNVYERRAYDTWSYDRAITGYNLLYDLVKLRYRFVRPNLQVSNWSKGMGLVTLDVNIPLERWKFDTGWGHPSTHERYMNGYNQARISRTLWPSRASIYDAGPPGGLPNEWIQFKSPMPTTFIYKSENDAFTQALLAWQAGAHLRMTCHWRFIDYKTKAEGLYTPSVNLALTDVGPSPELLEKGIEHTFLDAPLKGPGDAALDPTRDAAASIELDDDGKDPAAARKNAVRIGVRLMQKHLYDCARIYASLPPVDARPDVLVVQPGLGPASTIGSQAAPVIAARELPESYDMLPGVNMLAGRDLGRYRFIIIHNATLLRDETIRDLTRWLKETPGLLVVHQDLTSDKSAQASTPAEHSGVLKESWPWEADLLLHPPAADASLALEKQTLLVGDEKLAITADKNMTRIDCRTAKATPLARVGEEAVLARWRDPAFRGAVLFDGLRSPSKPYVDRLAAEINDLAAKGIGRAVRGRAVVKEIETEKFHAAASPAYGDPLKTPVTLRGVDLMTGVVDPVVGPGTGSAIVARADHFGRYLACSPSLVALGDRPYTKASRTEAGLLLQNPGVIQLAGRGPVKVTRQDGKPLEALPFDFQWVFAGTREGVSTFTNSLGVKLTFVRSAEPVVVAEGK